MDLAQKLKNLAGNQRDKLLDDSTARYYDKASDSFKTPEIKAAEKQIKDLTKMAQKAESPEEADILLSQADELHEVIEESQALDFKSLTDIRKYLDGKAANAHKSQSKSTEHIRKVSNMVRDIEDDIAMGIDPDYKSIKHLLGQVNDLNKLAKSAAGKAEREALGGITAAINRSLPTILGTTVGAVGGPAGAAAGAIAGNRAGKIWAKYGPQFKAAGFDAANKLTNDPQKLKQLVDAAEKGGATAIGATHFKLMQEDPEYRKKYMKKKDK
jgi:hypothetical protein